MTTWLLSDGTLRALGWALLHSFWQLTLLGVLAWATFGWSRERVSAAARYRLAVGWLMAGAGLFLLTCWAYSPVAPVDLPAGAEPGLPSSPATALVTPAAREMPWWRAPVAFLESRFFWLVAAWLFGVLVLSIRQLAHFFFLSQFRHVGLEAPGESWRERLPDLQKRLGVTRPVALWESALAGDLLTFGHFRPYILAPVGLLAGLPVAQVEALLLHELAHIRRHDFLVNLLTGALEILLFYHPAVWWLSAEIRRLREEACDERVVRAGVDPLVYADALVALSRFTNHSKYDYAMTASAHFTQRIRRLLGLSVTEPAAGRLSRPFAFLLTTLLLFSLTGFTGLLLRGQPTVSVAADHMNVLYYGLDNPLTVAVAGVPSEQVRVSSEEVALTALGDGRYNARPLAEGEATLRVTGPNFPAEAVRFRVKRLPDPVATLGGKPGGAMPLAEFQALEGIEATPVGLDLPVDCPVLGYSTVWVPKQRDPVEYVQTGGPFAPSTRRLIEQAGPGDVFYFDEVTCQCPGDAGPRKINALVVKLE